MNGVPFEVACGLSDTQRLGWVVAVGTLRGLVFDWGAMRWQA
jgi:hypothetical protein